MADGADALTGLPVVGPVLRIPFFIAAMLLLLLGAMPLYTTGTGFLVTPVVALVRPGFELQLDPFEVAEAFEVCWGRAPRTWLTSPHDGARAVGGRGHALPAGRQRPDLVEVRRVDMAALGQRIVAELQRSMFGRLIRARTDRGAVVLLDSRVVTMKLTAMSVLPPK